MTYIIIAVCVVLFLAAALFVSGHGRSKWMGEVARYLFRLNVAAPELPAFASNRFYSEGFTVYRSTKGRLNPQIYAIQYFAWYLTEFPNPKLTNVINPNPLEASLKLLRSWAENNEPENVQAAAADAYNRICAWVAQEADKDAA